MKRRGEYIIESATNSQKQFFCEQFSKAMTKLSSSAGYTRDLLQTMLNNLDMDVLKTLSDYYNTEDSKNYMPYEPNADLFSSESNKEKITAQTSEYIEKNITK